MQTAANTITERSRRTLRITSKRPAGKARIPSPAKVEGIVLSAAQRLTLDAAKGAHEASLHVAHIAGYIALALELGIISEDRAVKLHAASLALLQGVGLIDRGAKVPKVEPMEPDYARVVGAVRRHGGASLSSPEPLAELGIDEARAVLDQLRADGVIGEPDMLGFSPARTGH